MKESCRGNPAVVPKIRNGILQCSTQDWGVRAMTVTGTFIRLACAIVVIPVALAATA
jgi:hypothetical protein